MALELRSITDDEFPDWTRTTDRAFGMHVEDDVVEAYRPITEIDRTVAVFDRGQIVATAGAFTFELTVPGDGQVDAAGVTMVSVRASHRRRGLLTRMMEHQLDDVADRGEPLAILLASEAPIYGRFGYGMATPHALLSIDTDHARFRTPFEPAGRYREVDVEGAAKVFPGVHEKTRRRTPGDVSRTKARWDHWFSDPVHERHGASARFYVVYESAKGKAEGYLAYRIREDWRDGIPQNELSINDFAATTPDAYAALWRYALDVDLVGKVTAWGRPLDEPVRWLLADSRRLQTKVAADFLWVRIVDVPAVLSARRYGTDDRLVIDVVDDFGGRAAGRFVLEGGPDGSSCRTAPGRARVDLTLDVAALGSVYLAGVSVNELARAGRISEERAGAVRRADAMFRTGPMPHCRTAF